MRSEDNARDDLILMESDRLGRAAEYTGEGWDEAVRQVLTIMIDEGRTPVDAIGVYQERHRKRMRASVKVRTTQKVTAYRVPKAVLDVALDLAGGDISRLRISEDGTVTVVNKGKGKN